MSQHTEAPAAMTAEAAASFIFSHRFEGTGCAARRRHKQPQYHMQDAGKPDSSRSTPIRAASVHSRLAKEKAEQSRAAPCGMNSSFINSVAIRNTWRPSDCRWLCGIEGLGVEQSGGLAHGSPAVTRKKLRGTAPELTAGVALPRS